MHRHLLGTFLAFVGCTRSSDTAADGRLDESRRAFDRREAETGHYTYVRSFASFAGFGADTSVDVVDDRVTERSYRSWHSDPAGQQVTDTTWSETGTAIGSHAEAFPPKAMPELYDECERSILTVDRVANDVTLRFDASQILAACYYTPHNCDDDCAVGIQLSSVAFTLR